MKKILNLSVNYHLNSFQLLKYNFEIFSSLQQTLTLHQ